MRKNKLTIILVLTIFAASCVPTRQFQELKNKTDECVSERDSLQHLNQQLTVSNTERASQNEEIQKRLDETSGKNQQLQDSINLVRTEHKVIKKMYDDLASNRAELLKGNAEETRTLLAKLQVAQEDLQQREDKLHQMGKDLNHQQDSLNQLQQVLDSKNKSLTLLETTLKDKEQQLATRTARLQELEHILYTKDSVVNALKTKVSDALLGFQNKGLTIEQKNGKVYVSLEEQLLFKFGSTDVDPKGVTALKNLAKVLEQNEDINIMIEGHTDDVGKADYNWDLSVKRATSIVKILLNNSAIDPKRLSASGRGEFMPIDPANTEEARRKNRRTEIILTPKLDELFKILESN